MFRHFLSSRNLQGLLTVLMTLTMGAIAHAADNYDIPAPTLGPLTLEAHVKTWFDLGRKYELETIGGRNYFLKNEGMIGFIHTSGFGLEVTATSIDQGFDDPTLDSHTNIDSSVILQHSNLYESKKLIIGGKFRQFFPTSDSSQANNVRHSMYYSTLDLVLSSTLTFSNTLIPEYYFRDTYADGATDFYLEDESNFTWQQNKWFSLGFGQYLQIERHKATPTGTTDDVYPFVDLKPTANIFVEFRYYTPLFVSGVVGGGSSAVAFDQSQAELILKIHL